ncbi:MAG TPA: TetR/AcrR family transcriptional regulator [Mycobacterium sp.]|jgi:AcrR family transcriptional regulator
MATTPTDASAPVRRRPKDRKAQVERAAAEGFSESGYHAVGMDAIAAKVGISAAALYRHYPSKYDLFCAAVLSLGQQLVDSTDLPVAPSDAEQLHRLINALIDVTLANRESGGLYRWQARYLRPADTERLNDQIRIVNRRIQSPLIAIRPDLSSSERRIISAALLSVIGSIIDHRVDMPADQIRALFVDVGLAVLAAELPAPDTTLPSPRGRRLFSGIGTYEALLQASMVLFDEQGFRETSMEQIAAAVGIPASGIYRYVSGKADLLATVMRRAADRVSGELSVIVGADTEPRRVLTELIEAYVATSFANPELAFVYYTERVNLPVTDDLLLRNVQRSTIDSWVGLLTQVRADITATDARFLVHAAMAVVVDVGRLVHYGSRAGDSAHSQACVRKLMELTLFGA